MQCISQVLVQIIEINISFGWCGVYIMYYIFNNSDKFLYARNVSCNYDKIQKHQFVSL